MITIHKPQMPKVENLKQVYDVCNKIFRYDKCFYSKDEVHKLKQKKSYIFIRE